MVIENKIFAVFKMADELHGSESIQRGVVKHFDNLTAILFVPIDKIEGELMETRLRDVDVHGHGFQAGLRILGINATDVARIAVA